MAKGIIRMATADDDIFIEEDIPSGVYEVEKLDSPENYVVSKVAYEYPDVYPTEYYVEYDNSTEKISDIPKTDLINISIKSKD